MKYHILHVDLRLFASVFRLFALVLNFLGFKQACSILCPGEEATSLQRDVAPLR